VQIYQFFFSFVVRPASKILWKDCGYKTFVRPTVIKILSTFELDEATFIITNILDNEKHEHTEQNVKGHALNLHHSVSEVLKVTRGKVLYTDNLFIVSNTDFPPFNSNVLGIDENNFGVRLRYNFRL